MKTVRLILLLTCTLVLVAVVSGTLVLAQGEPEPTGYKNVTVWVNPEYDDPRLLVMMEGKIDGATAPATVRFLVPQAAFMYSAGSKDAFGDYTGGPPDRKPSDIPFWDEISYVAKSETFRVEYYDPVISGQPDKTFTYEFNPLYPISGLQVIVQQPKRATDFQVQAADNTTGKRQTDAEGFIVMAYNYPTVTAGSTIGFQVSYNKPDSNPSLQTTSTGGQSSSSGSSNSPASSGDLLWVGIAVAAVLVAGILWVMKARPTKKTFRQTRSKAPAARLLDSQQRARFCRKCGYPLKSNDKFCTNCGVKL